MKKLGLAQVTEKSNRSRKSMIWRNIKRAAAPTIFGLALLVAASCSLRPDGERDTIDDFTRNLDERLPHLMKQYSVPGVSIALVREGQLVWSSAYGYADLEQKRRMTVEAVYRVESISKPLTAWGVMRLVERGLVDLDAPVQQYLGNWVLPESQYALQDVTVRRLLSHNAGMPLGSFNLEFPPQGHIPSLRAHLSQEAHLVKEPGLGFLYANTGFNLLELLVESVTGQEFAAYMDQEVLKPLGMQNSSFTWDEAFNPVIPTGYDLKGKPVPLYVYPSKASGGLFATVEDIARFTSAGITGAHTSNQTVLDEESLRMLHTPQVNVSGIYGVVSDAYGFGHFIENLSNGEQAVWHGGQGHGWMTHFHLFPESGDAIVLLTNSQRSWPLMAEVLREWAWWSGFETVKMSRITHGVNALWVLIGGLVMASVGLAYRLAAGLRGGRRRFAPFSDNALMARLLQALAGGSVIAALAWSAAQPYLTVSAIFPGVSEWAGRSLFGLALMVIVSALFPRQGD